MEFARVVMLLLMIVSPSAHAFRLVNDPQAHEFMTKERSPGTCTRSDPSLCSAANLENQAVACEITLNGVATLDHPSLVQPELAMGVAKINSPHSVAPTSISFHRIKDQTTRSSLLETARDIILLAELRGSTPPAHAHSPKHAATGASIARSPPSTQLNLNSIDFVDQAGKSTGKKTRDTN